MDPKVSSLISEFIQKKFPKIYDINRSKKLWKEQSQKFRNFWENRIMSDEGELSEDEMIPLLFRYWMW